MTPELPAVQPGSGQGERHPSSVRLPDGKTGSPAHAWTARAEDLARWTLARLVNRRDVWGCYSALDRRGQQYRRRDGTTATVPTSYTVPSISQRGTVLLGLLQLLRHFRAAGPEDLVGLHAISPDNTSLWGALDIDWHGPESTAMAINLGAALAWYEQLARQGWHPLLTSSNGTGGYHLRLLLAAPVDSARLFAFLQQLVRDHRRHGMTAPPETFPKQSRLAGETRFGNWLRLPGRHHTRSFWSEVWDGCRWLTGAQAVEHVLGLEGDPLSLVPLLPPAPPPCPPRRWASDGDASLSARIAAYVARVPNLGEGQGRDDVAFKLAAFLVRDLGVGDDVALSWLVRWDSGNRPPKGEKALEEILANARRYGQNVVGSGRGPEPARYDRRGHRIITVTAEVG